MLGRHGSDRPYYHLEAQKGGDTKRWSSCNENKGGRYLQKTYLKTAKSHCCARRMEIAYTHGKNWGIAFRVGRIARGSSFRPCDSAWPGLYAWEEHLELGELIQHEESISAIASSDLRPLSSPLSLLFPGLDNIDGQHHLDRLLATVPTITFNTLEYTTDEHSTTRLQYPLIRPNCEHPEHTTRVC
ncbi:hypothetical protein AX14_006701 [Amanita brunnescens Koide BX004]|nr:hypothetical protein AX14_006701 [Amanita brunnescens Koide BX004]